MKYKPDLDILVLLDVGAFDSELACLGVKVDGLHADGEHGAHSRASHAACGRLRLHFPVRAHGQIINKRNYILIKACSTEACALCVRMGGGGGYLMVEALRLSPT